MNEEKKHCCGPLRVKLVFACSGASDVGGISDQAARRIGRSKVAIMSCVAGIGAQVPELLDTARAAVGILAIDGCGRDCARLCLERAGLHGFAHLQLERDLGWEKGKTPPTEERIEGVVNRGLECLRRQAQKEIDS